MSSDTGLQDRPDRDAAEWFVALNATSVSTDTLQAFQDWRRAPENASAYGRVERLWRSAGNLAQDPEILSAIEDAHARGAKMRSSTSRARLGWGLLAIALAAGAIGAITLMHGVDWTGAGAHVYETAIGEQRAVILEDGTRINLDTNTRVKVHYAETLRQVELAKGQALFDVVHNSSRPFQVVSGQALIRDIGTKFDVRREGAKVQVTLINGSVTVARTTKVPAVALTVGQQVALGDTPDLPHFVNLSTVTDWTTGRLIFNDLPLATAAAEVNRYGSHKIVLEGPELQRLHVTATFDINDPTAFVNAVTKIYNLKAENRPDGTISLAQAPG